MRAHRCVIPFVILGLSVSAVAADTPPKDVVHVDPGKEIQFVLERGRVTGTVPFDVPFFLVTPVDDSTKKGIAKIADSTVTKVKTAKLVVDVPKCGNYITLPSEARPFSVEEKKFMEFAIPALEVNRNYCLAFDVERDRNQTEFEKYLANMRSKLFEIYTSAEFAPAELARPEGQAKIRARIFDAVKRAIAPGKVLKEDARLVLTDEEQAAVARNPEYHPELAGPEDLAPLQMRRLVDAPRELIEQTRSALDNYVRRRRDRGEETSLIPELATDEQIAREVERVRGEIVSFGADSADGKDLAFILEFDLLEAQRRITQRNAAFDAISTQIDQVIIHHYDVLATTTAGYEARFHWYVSADMGMAVAPEIDEIFPYIGMNIALRPINKKAPLDGWSFRRRFAFTLGLSGNKMTTGDRIGVVDQRAVILGGGLRLNQHIRVSGGASIFKADDPDPLVTQYDLAVTPYVGLSVDVDIAAIVQSFFELLPGK